MRLFKRDPATEWQHALQVRQAAAERVWNSTYRREFFQHAHDIRESVVAAKMDPRLFPETFGERMPTTLQAAVTLEVRMWEHLETIVSTRPSSVKEYEQLCKRLHKYTELLIEVIKLQREMLTSCLTHHYQERINIYQRRATREQP